MNVLLALEMGEQSVEQKEACAAGRNRTAERREIVQLAEGAGECRLPALIGAGDDDDPFSPIEVIIVRDDRMILTKEGVGQGKVETLEYALLLARGRHLRVAEPQTRAGDAAHMREVGDVELNFAVEPADRRIHEVSVSFDKALELHEGVGKEVGDAIEHARLDMVHLWEVAELENVVGGRPLPELLEVGLDLGAVVGFVAIGRDCDEAASDQEIVSDRGESDPERRRAPLEPLKRR